MTAFVLLMLSALQIFCVMTWQSRMLDSIETQYAAFDRHHAESLRFSSGLADYLTSPSALLWPPRVDHAAPGDSVGHRAPIFCDLAPEVNACR